MPASTLLSLEAANMFCGKEANDLSNSLHLKLTEVNLPSIEENYSDHRGLGAPVAIEIDTVINRLECTFYNRRCRPPGVRTPSVVAPG